MTFMYYAFPPSFLFDDLVISGNKKNPLWITILYLLFRKKFTNANKTLKNIVFSCMSFVLFLEINYGKVCIT